MDRNCHVGIKPADDNGYFEEMTKAVFQSGFNWQVIENKWENFRTAFADFAIPAVAAFGSEEMARLESDAGIVRNYRKIEATLKNAREFVFVQQAFGSFDKYLESISGDGEEKMCKMLSKRFSHLGKATSMFFLRKVGWEMPETVKQWAENR